MSLLQKNAWVCLLFGIPLVGGLTGCSLVAHWLDKGGGPSEGPYGTEAFDMPSGAEVLFSAGISNWEDELSQRIEHAKDWNGSASANLMLEAIEGADGIKKILDALPQQVIPSRAWGFPEPYQLEQALLSEVEANGTLPSQSAKSAWDQFFTYNRWGEIEKPDSIFGFKILLNTTYDSWDGSAKNHNRQSAGLMAAEDWFQKGHARPQETPLTFELTNPRLRSFYARSFHPALHAPWHLYARCAAVHVKGTVATSQGHISLDRDIEWPLIFVFHLGNSLNPNRPNALEFNLKSYDRWVVINDKILVSPKSSASQNVISLGDSQVEATHRTPGLHKWRLLKTTWDGLPSQTASLFARTASPTFLDVFQSTKILPGQAHKVWNAWQPHAKGLHIEVEQKRTSGGGLLEPEPALGQWFSMQKREGQSRGRILALTPPESDAWFQLRGPWPTGPSGERLSAEDAKDEADYGPNGIFGLPQLDSWNTPFADPQSKGASVLPLSGESQMALCVDVFANGG